MTAIAPPKPALPDKTTCIIVDGPQANASPPDFDEHPVWYIFYSDDDGEPCHDGWQFFNYDAALDLAERLATRHGIECINDASPA